jgi:hypothetical protein
VFSGVPSVTCNENYETMSADEKAEVKRLHKALRKHVRSREGNLAWGFVRGFRYKRIERTHREHNEPSASRVTSILAQCIPGFASDFDPKRPWSVKPAPEVEAWLADPGGAIPAPIRVKRPCVRPEVA